jgi:hypothetical protein
LARRLSAVVFLFIFARATVRAAEPPETTLAGRSVKLDLIQGDTRARIPWPQGEVRIDTEVVEAGPTLDISHRLYLSGIEADSAAISLLYDLNPEISDLNVLSNVKSLTIPTIVASEEFRRNSPKGALVVLLVDSQLHEAMCDASTNLATFKPYIASQSDFFVDPTNRMPVNALINDIASWFETICKTRQKRQGPPSSRQSLIDLTDEANALFGIINDVSKGKRHFTSEDGGQIAGIHDDVRREIGRYDDVLSGRLPLPDSKPCCDVSVDIQGADASQLRRLRIYYALVGLFRAPPTGPKRCGGFLTLGSATQRLRPKDYAIWVAPDGEPLNILGKSPTVSLTPDQKAISVTIRVAGMQYDPHSNGRKYEDCSQ